MKNDWMLINYQVGKNGKNVSQTWRHVDGRQFALSGISLEDYCKRRPDDISAREILSKSKLMGLI